MNKKKVALVIIRLITWDQNVIKQIQDKGYVKYQQAGFHRFVDIQY